MTGLVIFAWFVITGIAFFFLLAGLLFLIVGPKFNGRFCFEALFPLAIGGLFAWWSYSAFPFTIGVIV